MKPTKHDGVRFEESCYMTAVKDLETHKLMLNGPKLKYAIDDFINESLRKRLKYGSLSEAQHRLVTTIREELLAAMGDNI